GDLWQSPRDWRNIVPAAAFPSVPEGRVFPETLSADWRSALKDERGRLYVGIRHARVKPAEDEVLQFTLTARGPIDTEKEWNADTGFDLGHDAIVRTFTAMTTAEAHKHWKRRV